MPDPFLTIIVEVSLSIVSEVRSEYLILLLVNVVPLAKIVPELPTPNKLGVRVLITSNLEPSAVRIPALEAETEFQSPLELYANKLEALPLLTEPKLEYLR